MVEKNRAMRVCTRTPRMVMVAMRVEGRFCLRTTRARTYRSCAALSPSITTFFRTMALDISITDIPLLYYLSNTNGNAQNGYTIDTDRRRKAFEENKKRTAAAGEAAKAKAKALAEKNKAAQAKAVARKKELAEQRKANAAAQ